MDKTTELTSLVWAFNLTNTASSSASDLGKVSVWDGATQVGMVGFTGTNTNAISTFASAVVLPKDADKDLTVKVDFAQIGTGSTNVESDLIAIDADTNGTNTQGIGVGSGSNNRRQQVQRQYQVFALQVVLNLRGWLDRSNRCS